MNRIKFVLLALLAVAATLVAPSSASAHTNAQIQVWNEAGSGQVVWVTWENRYSGAQYTDDVAKGQIQGEGTDYNFTSHALAIYAAPGWCMRWRIYVNGVGGSYETEPYSAVGRWISIYPGDGYAGGQWRVRALHYDC